MTEVVIHRCTLNVVRRDGWSWGPEPKRLLQGAMNVLPDLIGEVLGRLCDREANAEISAPVRINIPIRLAELGEMSSLRSGRLQSSPIFSLHERLTRALTTALQHHGLAESSTTHDADEPPSIAEIKTSAVRGTDSALVALLLLWLEQGGLERRLARFPIVSLEAWHRTLINEDPRHPSEVPAAATLTEIEVMIDELAGKLLISELDRNAILLHRIVIAVRTMKLLKVGYFPARLRAALDRVFPLDDVEPQSQQKTAMLDVTARALPAREKIRELIRRTASAPADLLGKEIHVGSALPFLLLGPLSRTGYLNVLAATFEAAKATHQQTTFAAALAYKVLEPPERGWRRKEAVLQNASAFAGRIDPIAGDELHGLATSISEHLYPLDSVLSDSIVEGHSSATPLLMQRRGTGEFLLSDIDGLFPIACCERLEELLPILARCVSSVLLIPAPVADPKLLLALSNNGSRFVTDAPPTRGESWRRIASVTGARWWTNDSGTPTQSLVRSAQALERCLPDAEELMDEVFLRRPIVPPPGGSILDRHISLAAAIALGTISWTLWNDREPTCPQLALQRFNDLDGRVSFTADHIRVRLPMGRRFQDLLEHRLLEDVADVPWFEGKVVQFSGG